MSVYMGDKSVNVEGGQRLGTTPSISGVVVNLSLVNALNWLCGQTGAKTTAVGMTVHDCECPRDTIKEIWCNIFRHLTLFPKLTFPGKRGYFLFSISSPKWAAFGKGGKSLTLCID